MSSRGMPLRREVLILLLALQTGCVAFRSGGSEEHRDWPPAPRPIKPTLRLAVFGRLSVNGKPQPLSAATLAWETSRDVYAASGLFSEVVPPGKEGDLTAELEMTINKNFSKTLALLWEFTLFLVPLGETFEFTWTTTFRDSAGRALGVVEKKESVVVVEELLLVLGAPFSSTPTGAQKSLMEDLNRSTLLDALEKGYLRP